ncbi:helix-turn-helix transcriptional regulator [Vibrio mediterranei]|uniref:helix-turn-helix transcriptional regulator n=1 Tax=Vibrio mediterranei TaxID=689 RepID=UPI0040682601
MQTKQPHLATENDRLIREKERCHLTSISRSRALELEKTGLHPKRIVLGKRSVAWRYSEIMAWVKSR